MTTADNPRLFSVQPAVDSRGTLTFTPAPDAHGKASIVIVLQDDGGTENGGVNQSRPVTLRIAIRPANDAPRVQNQTVATVEDQDLQITLAASDPEGDRLTWRVTPPRHGTLRGRPPHVTYKPSPDFFGTDSFTFQAKDRNMRSKVATVRIQVTPVNDAPVARARLLGEVPSLAAVNPVIVSANGSNAVVVFDASLSSDAEDDPMEFAWFSETESQPFAVGVRAANTYEPGTHRILLQASDGTAEATQHLDFEVISPAQAAAMLLVIVDNAIPNWRTKRPLILKLRAAMNSFEAGRTWPGVQQLHALQYELRALIPTHPDLAIKLIDATGAIIQALSVAEQ